MSVLVPSFPSSTNSHSHYFPTRRNHGNLSQSNKHMSLTSYNLDNDEVPFGVVNSMKQRLLDKFNQSVLLNTHHSTLKSSNENLLQVKSNFSPLKQTTRLSRSQDSLLNHHEPFISYLQPKQELIIIDATVSDEEKSTSPRLSYTELHVDEVPKPGTVSTVKNMFERQIRLSRSDRAKSPNISAPVHHQHREAPSPNRSRSISPNDMALRRQRRTTVAPLPTPCTSYPDLVISHTPPVETTKIPNEESVKVDNADRLFSSSDTADYQPLDFKSRLALFNRTDSIERSNEQASMPANIRKPSNPPPVPNFLTKPIVHHHQGEKKEPSSDSIPRSIIQTTKSVTFFGGAKVNENIQSTLPSSIDPPQPSMSNDEPSEEIFSVPDVIGGNVKLNKSSIFSGMKKDIRVQFLDDVKTFEYPSFIIAMAEHSSTDSNDEDDVNDDELERLARINAEFNPNNLSEKPFEPKGTLHTFRPTHLDQYELGSQSASIMSDKFSREKYFSLSENFSQHSIFKQEMTNHIQWSSMSTTTDLLF